MASSKDLKFYKESNTETSFDFSANPGSSARFENADLIESCPAILEPSKDKSRTQGETFNNPFEIFSSRPPPTPTFVPALVGSSSIHLFDLGGEQQNAEEYEKKKCCTNCCSAIYNCYSRSAIAFRNSRFFYIVQFLMSLLPLSTLVMGIKYSKYCNSSFPVLTFIIGMFGVLFVGVWISINVCHHFRRRCTGQQKFLVRLLFGFLIILLTIEMSLYFSKSPSFKPTDKSYCSKTFIDFTFYKYIAIGGSFILAMILYIPDFCSFICSFECSMPITDVPYDKI